MTFKLSEYELKEILKSLAVIKHEKQTPLEEKLSSILAWMDTMPPDERFVYLLGRKA